MNETKAVEKRERGTGRIWQMGRIWWVQFYDATGRQRRESSRSTTKKVAEKLLARRLGEKEAGSLPSHRARGLTYASLRDAYKVMGGREVYLSSPPRGKESPRDDTVLGLRTDYGPSGSCRITSGLPTSRQQL
jgi:hypothetical protein